MKEFMVILIRKTIICLIKLKITNNKKGPIFRNWLGLAHGWIMELRWLIGYAPDKEEGYLHREEEAKVVAAAWGT